MLVIPVIDIKDGKCVRKFLGHGEKTEYYTHTPLNAAKLLRKENFKAIHITDLDGALYGEMRNYDMIKEIAESVDVPILLGGGIRTYETAAKVFKELGVYRVVIGTAAITNPDLIKHLIKDFTSSKIIVGIDEKLNNVVNHGWIDYVNITPTEFAKRMEDKGIKRIIYQDVTRVGNLCGPHINRLKEIADNTNLRITSAGGICSYQDFLILKNLNRPQIDSVMVSRAIYENQFPCQKLWRDIEKEDTSLELPKVK
jgi:phosphoribosylformimino-5-aminoimidazole carboxamide ribotide isomerase